MNINEIAKMAGVSRTTVSRVFHGGYVSEDAKKELKRFLRKPDMYQMPERRRCA